MVEEEIRLIRRQLRSPRSAAVAGIAFSLLLMTSMVLLNRMAAADLADIDADLMEKWTDTASLALGLVPFAGIAFLWFTGVVRDRLGDLEDRFFSTIFLGSGIIFVMLMFTWAAIVGAIFGTYVAAGDALAGFDVYIFGAAVANQIVGNYTLRIAGVYMTSIGTLWTRTRVMPRWLSIITFIVALGFLFFANSIRSARFIFPAWVLLVSVYILILNYRRSHGPQTADESSGDD